MLGRPRGPVGAVATGGWRARATRRGAASGGWPTSGPNSSRTWPASSPGRARSSRATAGSRARRRGPGRCGTGTRARQALEYLFWAGRVMASRSGSTSSVGTTSPERVLPPALRGGVRRRSSRGRQQRELMRIAARALRGGHRTRPGRLLPDLPRAESRSSRVGRAGIETGELRARLAWTAGTQPAYLWPAARRPRSGRTPESTALAVRLPHLVPASGSSGCSTSTTASRSTSRERRSAVHGYYVLPFLLGENAGRAGRPQERIASPGVLRVQSRLRSNRASRSEPTSRRSWPRELAVDRRSGSGSDGVDVHRPRRSRPGAGPGGRGLIELTGWIPRPRARVLTARSRAAAGSGRAEQAHVATARCAPGSVIAGSVASSGSAGRATSSSEINRPVSRWMMSSRRGLAPVPQADAQLTPEPLDMIDVTAVARAHRRPSPVRRCASANRTARHVPTVEGRRRPHPASSTSPSDLGRGGHCRPPLNRIDADPRDVARRRSSLVREP